VHLEKRTEKRTAPLVVMPGHLAMLTPSAYVQCLFQNHWDDTGWVGGWLGAWPECVQMNIKGVRRTLYKFDICGVSPIVKPTKVTQTVEPFIGERITSTHEYSVGFVHGTHLSTILSILMDDGRLSVARRPKDHLVGAWVAEESDFNTCYDYAGPEQICGVFVQAFLVGKTFDLKVPKGKTTYRCMRSKESHVCTHVLIGRVDLPRGTAMDGFHFRPIGGMPFPEDFKSRMIQSFGR